MILKDIFLSEADEKNLQKQIRREITLRKQSNSFLNSTGELGPANQDLLFTEELSDNDPAEIEKIREEYKILENELKVNQGEETTMRFPESSSMKV